MCAGLDESSSSMESCKPYMLMTMKQASLAILLNLIHSLLEPSRRISAVVLVVYQQLVSSLLLCSLAFLFERGRTPKPSLQILSWAFSIAFLQTVLGTMMFTVSLRYVTATFQSVAMNTIPAVVFILAVATRRERFGFWGFYGQAKMWGILVSAAGATVMVVLQGDGARGVMAGGGGRGWLGCLMVGIAVLAEAVGNLLVERVALKYPAQLTLSAIMNSFGTIQILIVAMLIETNPSSWKIQLIGGSLQLLVILYGGIMVTGLSYWAQNWCISKKGPVFGSSFSPMLIVFSFFIETFIFRKATHPESILGAVLVIGGLYLLLWAKSKGYKIQGIDGNILSNLIESSSVQPMS